MSIRTRMIRRMRKNIIRLGGKITREELLNKNDDGTLLSAKKEWGYSVEVLINGHHICAPDRNKYEAFKGALCATEWASEYFKEE